MTDPRGDAVERADAVSPEGRGRGRRAVMVAFWAALTPRQMLFLETLRREGWRLTVVAWDREGNGRGPDIPEGLVDEVVVVTVPAPTWSVRLLSKVPLFYARLLREVGQREDVSLWILTHYLLLPVTPFLSGKVMYDAAEMYAVDLGHYAGRFRGLATAFLAELELQMARALDGVTTVDSLDGWLVNRFRSTGKPVERLLNVPALRDDPSRNGAHTADLPQRVAFAGGLMREKGMRVTLEAAAKVRALFPDVRFAFFGVVKDDAVAIGALIEDLGLADNVDFVDHIPYSDLQERLAGCSVGLALYQPVFHYPLVSAGNARKIFTYMQAGIPVIAPSFGEIGGAVRETGCGVLVDTEDPDAVAAAIVDLLLDPSRARRIGAAGRRAVEDRFNWEIESRKLVTLVERIVGGG